MNITCKSLNNTKIPATKQVVQIGKYLYKHLDGAFKIEQDGNNHCDVYFILLYEIPKLQRRVGHPEDKKLNEMHIDLNITTYQNKIRVNVIEVTEDERTLGSYTFSPEVMQNLNEAQNLILDKVIKRVSKVYEDYDFVF